MVHLATVTNNDDIKKPIDLGDKSILTKALDTLKISDIPADSFTSSVYGSKFARDDLPEFEIPEGEMPKEVAYRLIKDHLSLDGNPMLNLASFVTTYMVCLWDFAKESRLNIC
jgi:glutamate decarboxylase